MQRHYVTSGVPFSLGRTGEHLAREIVFDLRRWKKLYGEGEAQLMARRAGEKIMYAVPLDTEGDTVVWRVTREDNAIAGEDGECELRYILDDGTLAKSEVWTVSVQQSMNYETSDPPAEAKPWLDTLNEHIKTILELEGTVKDNAMQAATSAEVATTAEDMAAESAKNSEASAGAAAKSAEDAAASENTAAESAKSAAASAENAAVSEENAAASKENAAASESAAAESAKNAENYANNAESSAEQAAVSVDRIENMSIEAVTLTPGSAATVEKQTDGDTLQLVFGLPVATPLNGFFTLGVDEDGNLWVYSSEGGEPPEFEYNAETGDLYIIQEVE